MLVGVVYIYLSVGTTSYEALSVIKFSSYNQKWLWLAFFASFAAKVPMLPVHIWLPEAHACRGSYSWVGNLSRDSFKIGILWISTLCAVFRRFRTCHSER